MSRWSRFTIAVTAILLTAAVASPAGATKKPGFRLGNYFVKTSPALDASATNGKRTVFAMEYTLAQTAARSCGGSKAAKGTVLCLTAAADFGAYGTYSTTGVATNCNDGMGHPINSGYWHPVLRVPSSGRVVVDQTIRTERGEPSQLIKATLKISRTGVLTGTYQQTLYVSTGGPLFLGCTTGPLTLKGKLES